MLDDPLVPTATRPEPAETAAARWPWWFSLLGLLLALSGAAVLASLASGVARLLPGPLDPHLDTAAALAAQDVAFAAAAIALARSAGVIGPQTFALRRVSVARLLRAVAVAAAGFYAASALWTVLVHPGGDQDLLDQLGSRADTAHLLGAAVLAIAVAPVAEELLFRGFMYRALRNRLPAWPAAIVIGLIFSSLHYSGTETLGALPLLAMFGTLLCLLVERTGSLWPAIALHVVNNAVAVAADVGSGEALLVASVLAATALTGCAVAATRSPRAAAST